MKQRYRNGHVPYDEYQEQRSPSGDEEGAESPLGDLSKGEAGGNRITKMIRSEEVM